jgi:hypothetical protein
MAKPPPPPPAGTAARPGDVLTHPRDDLLGHRQRIGVRQLRGESGERPGAFLSVALVLGLPQAPQHLYNVQEARSTQQQDLVKTAMDTLP